MVKRTAYFLKTRSKALKIFCVPSPLLLVSEKKSLTTTSTNFSGNANCSIKTSTVHLTKNRKTFLKCVWRKLNISNRIHIKLEY